MVVTTASAIAMAQNTICFASIFLFLSRNIQPAANTTSITAASATYPATVRLYVTSESSMIFVTKKFLEPYIFVDGHRFNEGRESISYLEIRLISVPSGYGRRH